MAFGNTALAHKDLSSQIHSFFIIKNEALCQKTPVISLNRKRGHGLFLQAHVI